AQWRKFARLLAAGCRGVRAAERDGKRIRVVLHVHGGGREGLPQWFFKTLMQNGGETVDYDIIGLSYYPAWKDTLAALNKNMAELIAAHDKDILLAEVAYAWAPVTDIEGRESMQWPMTPEGQLQYLVSTREALAAAPGGRGIGFVWWYSDSIRVPDKSLRIWRDGAEALFDHDGNALPALSAFANKKP
ncbi:MAG TPA: glycosyl hydrolase 53 family protein, partial [Tepidisphaeraceae bacterium]